MRINRFQLALYMGFPFLASLASIVMIMHYLIWLEGIGTDHPYSDALIYFEMARDLDFFGETHITHRILVTGVAALIGHLVGAGGEEAYGIIFGALNFSLFITGTGLMFRIALLNQRISAFQIVLPAFIIALSPAFLRGAFFPMMEAGAFLAVAGILYALFFRKLWLLFPAAIAAVFIKEMALLAVLAVPLINYLRDDRWNQAYLPFIAAAALYILAALTFSPSLSNNYIFSPGLWFNDWQQSLSGMGFELVRYLLSSFGLALIYFAYKFYSNGVQKIYLGTLGIFAVLFIIFILFTPTNVPRLMFMALPFLVFFTFTDEQFREVFKWVLDPDSRPVENQPGEDEVSRTGKLGGYTEINLN